MAKYCAVGLWPRPAIRGKDEPDPVAAFSACAQLGEHCFVDGRLGFQESLQVMRIGGCVHAFAPEGLFSRMERDPAKEASPDFSGVLRKMAYWVVVEP